ncbi:MAG: zinc ribbon domain-containing protein [Thiotrichaceae bacterium]|nr:zinc ribbon domain-containing protein [Thiotrichaceae bacterium]
MATYDYHCIENNQIVEVKHSMSEKLTTWGEVCANAKIDLGTTPANSPVNRLISGGQVVKSSVLKNPESSCIPGSCCAGGGMCGL